MSYYETIGKEDFSSYAHHAGLQQQLAHCRQIQARRSCHHRPIWQDFGWLANGKEGTGEPEPKPGLSGADGQQ